MLSIIAYTPQLNSAVKSTHALIKNKLQKNTFCRCNDIGESESTVIGEGSHQIVNPTGKEVMSSWG
jgi:CDGSH-type Zn-finger protein